MTKWVMSGIVALWLVLHPADAKAGLANLRGVPPIISCIDLAKADISGAIGTPVSNMTSSEVTGDKAHCKVTGTIAPKINFEVRLPSKSWTQRYLQTGCGGLCGTVRVGAEKAQGCVPVTNGEIVLSSTDMGHQGMDTGWTANAQQQSDFAYRGVHLTALASKALIKAYYGKGPRYSYFAGCSDGGREALISAQRYPADYDGITAGAPALNFTVQNSFYHGWMALSNRDAAGLPILNLDDMPTLHSAAIKACDGLDGLKDGQITDPRQCKIDPGITLCKAGYQPGKCLTAAQIVAARNLYKGPRDETGRQLTAGGPMPGSELMWPGVFVPRQVGGSLFSEKIVLDAAGLIFGPNPNFRLTDIAFTAATFAGMADARALYNADTADLSPFAKRGGKLILWHGWNDQHISPLNSVDYFDAVGAALTRAKRDAMMRLFLLPGVGHCSGGDGPSDMPLLQSIMAWVEGGDAPTVMIAQRAGANMDGLPGIGPRPAGAGPGGPPPGAGGPPPGLMGPPEAKLPPRSRPVFAYPNVARYRGKGSIDDAASFIAQSVKPAPQIDWAGRR